MTIVRETHHRVPRVRAMMTGMDADSEPGRVLELPPAPDAIELRHLRAFVAVARGFLVHTWMHGGFATTA